VLLREGQEWKLESLPMLGNKIIYDYTKILFLLSLEILTAS